MVMMRQQSTCVAAGRLEVPECLLSDIEYGLLCQVLSLSLHEILPYLHDNQKMTVMMVMVMVVVMVTVMNMIITNAFQLMMS